jgi:hypothetical protein
MNMGANDVYLGPTTAVTTSGTHQGILLKGGQTVPTFLVDTISTSAWWGISTVGTSVVSIIETY